MNYFDAFSRPHSVLVKNNAHAQNGREDSRCNRLLAGPMPSRQMGLLKMGWYYDARKSTDFLCLKVERLAWPSPFAAVVQCNHFVCQALTLTDDLDKRDTYLKHCIEMIAPKLFEGERLEALGPAFQAMTQSWDLLEVFREIDALPNQPAH